MIMHTRRRFFQITAGVTSLCLMGVQARAAALQWQGIALGAHAQIILDHPDASRLTGLAVKEIRRLEAIFSLYQADSQLAQLNREGRLSSPDLDMLRLCSLVSDIHQRTGGAFDPTVQSLWQLYAQAHAAGRTLSEDEIALGKALTGWGKVLVNPSEIRFGTNGTVLTFNGIAQGYIADRVVDLLRRHGVSDALVNTGEVAAMGTTKGGNPWPVEIAKADMPPEALSDQAIATSAPLGTTFDMDGSVGHILDPRTGLFAPSWKQVSVIADKAVEADGLSTAFCLMSREDIEQAKGSSRVHLIG
jgi:thiamine biosynthesis lipoprotein